MQELNGQSSEPLILLHGGAGPMDPTEAGMRKATNALISAADVGRDLLKKGADPVDVVVACLKELENEEIFNCGLGSALQADGQVRMTAALMDGQQQKFSGVISVSYVRHPSMLARELQSAETRVMTAPGAELLARRMGMDIDLPLTMARVKQWEAKVESSRTAWDTVGCVVRSGDRRLAAGTSTGGRGFEFPGRVSDSGTVAGNYASSNAAISCTGIGEEIVDDAVAARIETRCRDGLSLTEASHRCFVEGSARQRCYGWIAIDREGSWSVAHLTPAMSFAVVSAGGVLSSSMPR